MKKRNASDLFVQALEAEGVQTIFALPGEENLHLLESLRQSSINVVVTRHEQAAGFMAATQGRLTGRAGVCLATLGPGATNLATPAAYATLGGFPLVMITGQKPIHHSPQGQFQMLDTVSLFDPICKFARQIKAAERVPSLVRDAFRIAEEERPGAVLLELPEDVASEQTAAVSFERKERYYATAAVQSVAEAADLIRNAQSPVLLIGAGANRRRTSRALTQFVRDTGLHFVATQMGKGVIDERSELYLGTTALSDGDYVHCALEDADLIVNIGHDVIEKPPFIMKHGGRTVIHVNYRSASVDPVYFPHLEVIGDIATSIERLGEAIGSLPTAASDRHARSSSILQSKIRQHDGDTRFPMDPQRIVADVRHVLGSDDIVTLDNGMYKIWFARNYPAHAPNTLLLDNALATMGAGLPSAMAAAMLHPDRKIVAVCGDGGFMMNSQELETAVRLRLNLVVLVLRDGEYGMIKWKQGLEGFDEFALDFGNPDFVKYAESYGARGLRVSATEDFMPMLARALDEGGVTLIDVPIDYASNTEVLGTELEQKSCSK